MIYLTGSDKADAPGAGLGLIVQPNAYRATVLERVRRYKFWAADNACFSQGHAFDEAAWWRWLWRLREASPFYCRASRTFCLFATAPDVVADSEATFRRGWTRLHHLRAHGLPAAFVAQDGLEQSPMIHLAGFWDEFDCLFVGGSTAWKLGPAAEWLVGEALSRRRWVHMGRVNTLRRLRYAGRIGCQSVDGTLLKYGPDVNLARLTRWLPALDQQELPLCPVEMSA